VSNCLYFIVSGVKCVNCGGLVGLYCEWSRRCELRGSGCIVL
jgi:hypothetical protein